MRIFAISDLHLSLTAPYCTADTASPQLAKPMSVFGAGWHDFFQRLCSNWCAQVTAEDAVLLAGDLSWAMTLEEARYDLAFLGSLPGRKWIVKGNHDFWWSSYARLCAALPPSVQALQHGAARLGGWAVCGTRGWLLPGTREFCAAEDEKIYRRELLRLEMALVEAQRLALPIIAMLHFPPLTQDGAASGFSELLERYGVRLCIYGHIHGDKAPAFEGELRGVRYFNTSADRLGLTPLLLTESADMPDGK